MRIDPGQIVGLGPSLEALMAMLRERKQKILQTYETRRVEQRAAQRFRQSAQQIELPPALAQRFRKAVQEEQLYDLERLWYRLEKGRGRLAGKLLHLVSELGEKYQIDELAAKYAFTGRTPMTIPQALEIKEELETIDRLLKQLKEAAKTAQIGVIDMEQLAGVCRPGRHRTTQRVGLAD